ncbi:MAG: quinone oxidoreductase [Rhizobiaceae bacterium]|nr:quinone oxidoreductase [Rhizobiaceae bacterium]
MAHAIILRNHGNSDALVHEDINVEDPKADELRIRQTGIGVNFHDIYVRSGLYKTLELPGIPGCEAVGVIEAIGENAKNLCVGDRVAYVTGSYGAYASHRILPAALAIKVPKELPDDLVASNLLRSMTVDMLLSRVAQVKSGDTILVQAAAGGVGRLLCQWASYLGATVIGTVGSNEKAERAKAAGCDYPILYRDVDFVEAVFDITNGEGVDIAYDSVGRDTFYGSLECLKFTGHLINFGQSSGSVTPLEMQQLATKSLSVSRPILFHYMDQNHVYRAMVSSAFKAFSEGVLQMEPVKRIPLELASQSHDILESRSGGGSLMFVP